MKKSLTEAEIIRLRRRLRSRLDYFMAALLWLLFFFSFISTWAVGALDQTNAGFQVAFQVAPILLFFPVFATFGAISDRILIGDLLKYSVRTHSNDPKVQSEHFRLSNEDYLRIGLTILLLFISLPWLAARLGLCLVPVDSTFVVHTFFFQPIHVGEHHGFIGIYMLLAILLISKTEKLYLNSIFKEVSIFGLCFAMIWGLGLVLDDFLQEQLNFDFPFWVWSTNPNLI
ncbi:MAG: hypothetical protein LUQ65_11680, partial [Candidatus Helarchaeota archaeon]|nr:hypothetical protein [Candidatus Helarchaeota archaeon]